MSQARVYQGQAQSKVNLEQAYSEITYTYPLQRKHFQGASQLVIP